jgi:hypothetical protein
MFTERARMHEVPCLSGILECEYETFERETISEKIPVVSW